MKTLTIAWQRLVTAQGTTCERCGNTGEAVARAAATLQAALRPLDIAVVLEQTEIDPAAFHGEPEASNRILIAGRPLESWLGASTGSSPCCGACGDTHCRTLELGGEHYDAVPENLILAAAFAALPFLADDGANPSADGPAAAAPRAEDAHAVARDDSAPP